MNEKKIRQKAVTKKEKTPFHLTQITCGFSFCIPDTQTIACFGDMSGCLMSQQIKLLGHRIKVPLWRGLSLEDVISLAFFSFKIKLLSEHLRVSFHPKRNEKEYYRKKIKTKFC
jgi:hypothetical protein